MDLNVLRTFVAVCEYSGFSAAGERLGYTQSTVSSQIRQLEKELNVALFDRFIIASCADTGRQSGAALCARCVDRTGKADGGAPSRGRGDRRSAPCHVQLDVLTLFR
ncbi:MAG: LysR family transcriptional regulator [Butyricicoccaceae bacterium]